MSRGLPPGGGWTAALALVLGIACRADPAPAPAATALNPVPAVTLAAGTLPGFDELLKQRPALALHAMTTVIVARGGAPVTLTDDRRLLRLASGDFDLAGRRGHAGSEEGDTEETLRVLRIGHEYYTRGSGGPFVRWDDARGEPDEALRSAWQDTEELFALAASCADVRREGPAVTLAGRPADGEAGCAVKRASVAPAGSLTVHDVSGELRWDGSRLVSVVLSLGLHVGAGEHEGDVTLQHRVEVQEPPATARIDAPAEVIESRRDRPARMIGAVLSGLVTDWGPGAPK